MYLLGEVGGHRYQAPLRELSLEKRLLFHTLTAPERERMAALMETYRDTPMDLADASLVTAAEQRALHRVFSIDGDFQVYRLADGSALETIP
jgi:predicted nucleic acid-binding protein